MRNGRDCFNVSLIKNIYINFLESALPDVLSLRLKRHLFAS